MNKNRYDLSWQLLLLSALLLHASLWNPPMFFWCSCIWLVPIFYRVLVCTSSWTWKDGFVWGLFFYSINLIPVTSFFVSQAHGWFRFLFPCFLIVYCAAHAALWFLLAAGSARCCGDSPRARMVAWFAWSVAYCAWVPHGLLWISGQYIGYPLVFPLLPLALYPQLLWLVPYLGIVVVLAVQIGISLSVALVLLRFSWWRLILVALLSALLLIGFFVHRIERVPAWCAHIGYVRPPELPENMHPLDAAQELYYSIREKLEARPEVTCLVMPELSYRYALNKYPHVVSLWNNNALHDSVTLLLGACREEESKLYNSVYMIKNGKIQAWYDKSRLMPLVESVSRVFKKIPALSSLFLHDNEFCARETQQACFEILPACFFEPYICAEIFFGKVCLYSKVSDNASILSITNDTVLSADAQFLMVLWNSLKALEWQRLFIYVGYNNALVITPDGNRHAIS